MRVDMASLAGTQGDYLDAKKLIRRSLQIRKATLGENHPDVASSLNILGAILRVQVM